jgi:hypothetical protein
MEVPSSTEEFACKSDPEYSGRKGNSSRLSYIARMGLFKGKTIELKGYVHDVYEGKQQAESYVRTTTEISEFVGKTYQFGGNVCLAVDTLQATSFPLPSDPGNNASLGQQRVWEKTIDEYVKRTQVLTSNIQRLYSLVLSQCTTAMKQRIQAHLGFAKVFGESDRLELLKIIKAILFNHTAQKVLPWLIHDALCRFYSHRQSKFMSTASYFEGFQQLVSIIEHIGGKCCLDRQRGHEKLSYINYEL